MTTRIKVTVSIEDKGEEVAFHTLTVEPNSEPIRRTAFKFNPDSDVDTEIIKATCAAAMSPIVLMRDRLMRNAEKRSIGPGDNDALRCFDTALTQLESAQMFAVKGRWAPKNAE